MTNANSYPIGHLAQKFLCSKKSDCDLGHLSPRTYADYCRALTHFTGTFGKDRDLSTLTPADFEALYHRLAANHGILTLAREVTMIRSACKYFAESLDAPMAKFGTKFKPPGKLAKRRARNQNRLEHGTRMFEPAEIRSILRNANRYLKAMTLLGINCGFGNTDCASLTKTAVDLQDGWIDFPRPKTAIPRRIPLWPETIRAMQIAMLTRNMPILPQDSQLVFITKYGAKWVRATLKTDDVLTITDSISMAFKTLLKALNIYRPGLSFYTLRHCFETIAGGTGDQVAVDAIMGHVDDSMAKNYREMIADQRLEAVTQHVRNWLFAEPL